MDAAQSGAITHNQTNWIQTVVTGPGTLSFWWKVSSEANYDFVRFFVNGVLQAQRSGEGDWVQASYVLGAGTQTLGWDYRKDPAVVAGADAAWVDQVSFTSANGVMLVRTALSVKSGVSSDRFFVTISKLEDGKARLWVRGPSGHEYSILASDNLAEWTEIGRITLGADSLAGSIDVSVPPVGSRFYKAVIPGDAQLSQTPGAPDRASR